jgi:hypothetical protein
VQIGSADSSELQFFAAGIMSFAILRNLLLEREKGAPPTDPYLVFEPPTLFLMSKMFYLLFPISTHKHVKIGIAKGEKTRYSL